MRIESSIITSLSELRAIEQQRIAEEKAAVERERLSRIEAQRAREQAVVDAEQARIRAEREERVRIEQARVDAEREARMKIEAAEAAERARFVAQLEERRMAEEIDLRRAEVAKKRPTWMIAVTVVAAIVAVGLGGYAVMRSNEAAAATAATKKANEEKEKWKQELRDAQATLDTIRNNINALDAEIAGLITRLEHQQTEADRKKAAAELVAANERRAEAARLLRAEEVRKAKIERNKVLDVSKCTGTALGCLEHK
jgi:hypothetical protein